MSLWKKLFGSDPVGEAVACASSDRSQTNRSHVLDLGQGVHLEFVQCPEGDYRDHRPGRNPEITTHLESFWICKTPVTQAQWSKRMGQTPFKNPAPDLPVTMILWDDIQSFMRSLNGLLASSPDKHFTPAGTFRLPTKEEWEYACRAGVTSKYSFGEDPNALSDYAWFKGNSQDTRHPVGQKKPNAWGIHDMHGNVWEYCDSKSDWHRLKGGSYVDLTPEDKLLPCGEEYEPRKDRMGRNANVGFRCVYSQPKEATHDVPATPLPQASASLPKVDSFTLLLAELTKVGDQVRADHSVPIHSIDVRDEMEMQVVAWSSIDDGTHFDAAAAAKILESHISPLGYTLGNCFVGPDRQDQKCYCHFWKLRVKK